MSKTIKLEVSDTGNATANMILLFNAYLEYGRTEAQLSAVGVARLISVFEDSSKQTQASGEVECE